MKIGSIFIFQDLTPFKELDAQKARGTDSWRSSGRWRPRLAHLQDAAAVHRRLHPDPPAGPQARTDGRKRLIQVALLRSRTRWKASSTTSCSWRASLGTRSETDVGRLVRDVIESAHRRGRLEPEVALRRELGQGLKVMGDPAEIRQVLWNLMINAIQAMPDGGTLTVTACPDGDNGRARAVKVAIGDTGGGIDQPTSRSGPSATKGGAAGWGGWRSGAARIVESHGGSRQVQSESPGRRRSRPASRVAPGDSDGAVEAEHPDRQAAAAGSRAIEASHGRILVVDDDRGNAGTCSTSSTSWATGRHGRRRGAALGSSRKKKFDLVITDLKMPRVDGIDLLQGRQGYQHRRRP